MPYATINRNHHNVEKGNKESKWEQKGMKGRC